LRLLPPLGQLLKWKLEERHCAADEEAFETRPPVARGDVPEGAEGPVRDGREHRLENGAEGGTSGHLAVMEDLN